MEYNFSDYRESAEKEQEMLRDQISLGEKEKKYIQRTMEEYESYLKSVIDNYNN